ncbi:MAG: DUF1499 domain-containing protein [Deltaproteobacteria bacterium]
MAKQTRPRWLDRFAFLALTLMVAGVAGGFVRLLPALNAFYLFAVGGFLSCAMILAYLVRRLRGRAFGAAGVCALLGALTFGGTLALQPDAPPINDFTTDLGDPPLYDHARTLPLNLGRDFSYPESFRPIQEECCSDLAPLQSTAQAPEAFAAALEASYAMPLWKITSVIEADGHIEAVAETEIFGFRDDIVIRIRKSDTGSIVDMRSRSRDGRGDIGANAARIRTWTSAYQRAAGE